MPSFPLQVVGGGDGRGGGLSVGNAQELWYHNPSN